MGLLDDAIREHLELKRAHGADPGEVERQEREVLGAPRSPAQVAQDAAPPAVDEDAPAPVSEPVSEAVPDPVEPPPVTEPEHRGAVSAERFSSEPDLDWTDPRGEPAAAVPAEDEAEEEDVLEETPEFLQETPEHDRLWFEQRPPRDFDF